MDKTDQNNESGNYKYLIEKFGREKIKMRYSWLYEVMEEYIQSENISDAVIISSDILNHVIVDYFVDVDRLKDFQEIEKTHDSKIYAYLSFWILRHKPLQLIKSEQADKLSFVNEVFVCKLLQSYLFSNPANVPIRNDKQDEVDNFVATLLYYFKYRDYSAKSIEIMILAFGAGRGYQYSVDNKQ